MRVTLQVAGGPYAGKRFVLSRGQSATFGRTPLADYQFADDGLMSSRHFAVEVDGQGCRVRDLESRNGTYVDEKRVIERAVTSGCTIRAGDTKLTVTLAEAPAMPPLPADSAAVLGMLGRATPSPVSKAPDFFPKASVALPAATGALAPQAIASAAPLSVTKVAAPSERWRSQASRAFELALDDADADVRRNALLAATWQGRRWVLDYCRGAAAHPVPEHWDALLVLSILGQPDDLSQVLAIGRTVELGPRRFAALGAFGHPQVMGELMTAIESQDAAIAMAAAQAFTKITGVDICVGGVSALAAPAEPGAAPDSAVAARAWQSLKSKSPGAVRWCRGYDISRGVSPDAFAAFDLESRWEACLRGRFSNRWEDRPLDAEQLVDALHEVAMP